MAQTLEKIFLQKVASMPQEEQELVVTILRTATRKGPNWQVGKRRSFANGDPRDGSGNQTRLFVSPAALQGSITSAHPGAAVSSVSHTALYTPPEIPTTVLNIPHPSVISSPLLQVLALSWTPLLAVSAAPPAALAKVYICGYLWGNVWGGEGLKWGGSPE